MRCEFKQLDVIKLMRALSPDDELFQYGQKNDFRLQIPFFATHKCPQTSKKYKTATCLIFGHRQQSERH